MHGFRLMKKGKKKKPPLMKKKLKQCFEAQTDLPLWYSASN